MLGVKFSNAIAMGMGLVAASASACAAGDSNDTSSTFVTGMEVGADTSSEATGDTTDPSTTDPSTTDPSTTDPSTTDPSTTDPSTTDPTTGGDEVSVMLTVTANQGELGDAVTLSWVTTNAASCTTVTGTEAWQMHQPAVPEGSVDILLDRTGDLVFALECEGMGGGMDMAEQVVNVSCPPPEVAEGELVPWPQYWEAIWPETSVMQLNQGLFPNEYLSISFNTGDVLGYGKIQTIQLTGGVRRVAISECEGVFKGAGGLQADNPCFENQANGQELEYSTDGSFDCELLPNRTYYVNVTYMEVEDDNPVSNCNIDFCSFAINSAFITP